MSDVYTVDITGRKNADLYHPFQMTDAAGLPMDITGNEFKCLFTQVVEPDVVPFTYLLSTTLGTIPLVAPLTGQFALSLDYAIWALWPSGKYKHDLTRQSGTSNEVVWTGTLNLKTGITPLP